jgi:hypothetical protein
MVHYKSLFVALAAVSTVAAGPCKLITRPALSTTTTVLEEAMSTSVAETTSTYFEEPTTTEVSTAQETDTTITAAPTTTTDITSTTTAAETTTSAAAPPGDVCGITGLFLPDRALTMLHTPGLIASVKECLQGCAAWEGCEAIAYYSSGGRCEYFSGELVTDGFTTEYKWYEVGCLAYE